MNNLNWNFLKKIVLSNKFLLILRIPFLLIIITSCEFHALYGENLYSNTVMNDLYNIHVVPLENRDGQLLHNELLTNLNPHGEYYKPRYNLLVSSILSEKQHTFRKDSLATRNTLIYTVTFSLNEKSTRLFTDTFNQMFSYDYELLEKHYSNISAVDDIHHRAAKTIADEIRNRLAVYFIRSNKMKKENLINETNR